MGSRIRVGCQGPKTGHISDVMTCLRSSLLLVFASISLVVHDVAAQSKAHPAQKVAEAYMRAIQTHEWAKAADMVETKSLANLKVFQKRYLMNAPTLPEEEALLAILGLKRISDIDALSPKEVYVRRGQAKTKQLKEPKKHIGEMKQSVVVKTLGTVSDGPNNVHTMIRKEFMAAERAFSELAFVSLVKEGKSWKISLDAQEPKMVPAANLAPLPKVKTKPHGAHQVALNYQNAVSLHDWESASLLVDTESLKSMKGFQKRYLRAAPGLAEEQELLRLLGLTEISDLDDMTPRAIYISRGKATTKRLMDPEKHIAELQRTLKIVCLGTATEGDDMVHAALRKQFSAQERGFSELLFVTLKKEGTVWKVSLDAQEPKVFAQKGKKK